MAPWIIEHFPVHICYVGPFGGGASVLLRKPSSKIEVYNDLAGDVVNFFTVLRTMPDDLVHAIKLTPYSRAEYENACDAARDAGIDPLERARRFYIMSWQGWGGHTNLPTGWRWQRGTSRGKIVTAEWSAVDHLYDVAARFKHVLLENDKAEAVIVRFDSPGTLFYCDPPYPRSTRSRQRVGGYACEMTDDDHRRLAEILHSVQGIVIISSYPSALYDELYADWHRVHHKERTCVQTSTIECLWISRLAQAQGTLL